MLRRSARALVLVMVVVATLPLPSLALGLSAADEPVMCDCGCGREEGSCCCAAPRGSDLAMRCHGDSEDAEVRISLRPPAVLGVSVRLEGPGVGSETGAADAIGRYAVDLEPDLPIPEDRAPR
jgi:hypothetical protein